MLTAGIDIGSTTTKALLLERNVILSTAIRPTLPDHTQGAWEILGEVLSKGDRGYQDLDYIVGTGYGRVNIPFADHQITEITCHGRGVYASFPTAKTVIEVGGQDCKVIKLCQGKVEDFAMNDKCAAGTGRFLQYMAQFLSISLEDMNTLALTATSRAPINSICTIFVQQEVVGLLSQGVPADSVIAGIFDSVARKILMMAANKGVEDDVVLTGGGTQHAALREAIARRLNKPLLFPQDPFLTGAYGAAILARERAERMDQTQLAQKRKNRLPLR